MRSLTKEKKKPTKIWDILNVKPLGRLYIVNEIVMYVTLSMILEADCFLRKRIFYVKLKTPGTLNQ